MIFLQPIAPMLIAIAAAVLAGLLVVAYILKMRRRRFEVPFSTLWQRVLRTQEATSWWRHLKRILSLLLLATMIGLLLFAALEPILGGKREDARSIVVIIDTSASMKTIDSGADGSDSRLVAAKAMVVELLDGIGSDDAVMLMSMDGRATPLSRFQSDVPKLKRTILDLYASDTPANLRGALSVAADSLRWRRNPQIIIVGDGAYPEEALQAVHWESASESTDKRRLSMVDLSNIAVHYRAVGATAENVGIIGFNVRRYISNKLNYEVYIEVENFSDAPVTRRLVLYNGDAEIEVKEIQLAAKERTTRIYPNLGGGTATVLRARLETAEDGSGDAFALDDEAWALIPSHKRQHVLLVTETNRYIESALGVFDHLSIEMMTPAEYQSENTMNLEFDAVIYHNYTPEEPLGSPTHLLYFNPSGPHSPFPVSGHIKGGRITAISESHPVMRWLQMDDVFFDSLSSFSVEASRAEVSLARSIRSTVAVAKKDGRRKIAAFGFSMEGTDIMLRVAFPLLMVNTLDWFAGADSDLITTYTTGHRARVPVDGTYGISEITVRTPSGKLQRAAMSEGYANFFASEVGVHLLSASADGQQVATISLAANLSNPNESDIEPSSELILGGKTLTVPELGTPATQQSLWMYLCLFVLLLLFVEWYTFNRRITV